MKFRTHPFAQLVADTDLDSALMTPMIPIASEASTLALAQDDIKINISSLQMNIATNDSVDWNDWKYYILPISEAIRIELTTLYPSMYTQESAFSTKDGLQLFARIGNVPVRSNDSTTLMANTSSSNRSRNILFDRCGKFLPAMFSAAEQVHDFCELIIRV